MIAGERERGSEREVKNEIASGGMPRSNEMICMSFNLLVNTCTSRSRKTQAST